MSVRTYVPGTTHVRTRTRTRDNYQNLYTQVHAYADNAHEFPFPVAPDGLSAFVSSLI
jgi:hypothetical protein